MPSETANKNSNLRTLAAPCLGGSAVSRQYQAIQLAIYRCSLGQFSAGSSCAMAANSWICPACSGKLGQHHPVTDHSWQHGSSRHPSSGALWRFSFGMHLKAKITPVDPEAVPRYIHSRFLISKGGPLMKRLVFVLSLFLASTALVFAQATATINGRIVDPADAVVPNATVTVTNVADGSWLVKRGQTLRDCTTFRRWRRGITASRCKFRALIPRRGATWSCLREPLLQSI